MSVDLNRKLRLERKLFRSMRHIFSDMAAKSTDLTFSTRSYLPEVATALETHYALVTKSFASNYRRKNKVVMDELQEALFKLDLASYIDNRVFNASKTIIGTSEEQFKSISSIIIKANADIRNGTLRRNVFARLLKSRLNRISISETQWTAEFSKFLEVGYLTGMMGTEAKTQARPAKGWDTLLDDAVRPHHADAEGQLQFLSDPFTVNGESLMYPTDQSLGATANNVVNCRCETFYDLSKKDLRGARIPDKDLDTMLRDDAAKPTVPKKKGKVTKLIASKIRKKVQIAVAAQGKVKLIGTAVAATPFDDALIFLAGKSIGKFNVSINLLRRKIKQTRDRLASKRKRLKIAPGDVGIITTIGVETNRLNRFRIRLKTAKDKLQKELKVEKALKKRLAEREKLLARVKKAVETDDIAESVSKIKITKVPSVPVIDFERWLKFFEDPELFGQLRFIIMRRNTPGNAFKKLLAVLQLSGIIDTELRREIKFLFFSKKDSARKIQRVFIILNKMFERIPSAVTDPIKRPIIIAQAKLAIRKLRRAKKERHVFPGGPPGTNHMSNKRFSKWLKDNFPNEDGWSAAQRNLMFKLRRVTPLVADELVRGLELIENLK